MGGVGRLYEKETGARNSERGRIKKKNVERKGGTKTCGGKWVS
jgi:hypothetical protein